VVSTADAVVAIEDQEPYASIVAAAREVAEAVEPDAERVDELASTDPGVRAALAASGLCGLVVPAELGGRFERIDALAVVLVREVLMATSAHLDTLFAMQGIGSFALATAGPDDLRRAWLPRIASLDALAALALTEPEAGSDLKALTTSVRVDGGDLVVDGAKSFISNAGDADLYTVLAREGDGYSLVAVPAEASGVRVVPTPTLIAPHVLGDVELDQVRVPLDHRIGAPGRGFGPVLATLATFRVSVAGASVGLASRALAEAVRHCRSRSQFGRPLAEIGPVAQLLGRSRVDVEMARRLTYHAAQKATIDPRGNLHLSSMAKVGATEAAARVVDASVQVMGRWGLIRGSAVERLYRAARPMRIYEGATEVLLDQIASHLVRTTG
jgi:acyl-CoA dehydrogenase